MQRVHVAALAAALALGSAATHASDTFGLTAHGDGTFFAFSGPAGVPGGCYQYLGTSWYEGCVDSGIYPVTFNAVITVTTDSNADGVYTGDTLDQVTYSSAYTVFVYNKGDLPQPDPFYDGNPVIGLLPGATVTIADGVVSSFELTYDQAFSTVNIDGLNVSDQGANSDHDASSWVVTGVAVSDVPEPAPLPMLLGGLAAGWLIRSRGASVR